jgi:hypothetical protein
MKIICCYMSCPQENFSTLNFKLKIGKINSCECVSVPTMTHNMLAFSK